MNPTRQLLRLAPVAALFCASGIAQATTGYFAHGYGLRAQGMGGTSTALAQDAFGGANNPASMVFAGSRLDIGAVIFRPFRDAERSGAGFPTLNGKVDSDRTAFLIPEVGYNRMLGSDLSLGVSVYGNGGMNTNYPQGSFNCGAGPANMLCGGSTLGVNLIQLIVAPTVAYKVAERHAVGASLLLGYQRFKADGLQAFDNAPGFPPFTGAPGSVTNRSDDDATGVGLRVGYQGRLTDMVTVGASYSTKVNMSRFSKYKGLFAGNGAFDIPSNYSVGIAVAATPALTLALDVERINYSDVPSVNNPSQRQVPLGASNGPGFGWQDIDVVKVGASWRMSDKLTLRAGYTRSDNPIGPDDVTFNILAPGVMKDHYTAGFSIAMAPNSEFTASAMFAPRQSVTGASLFNAVLGPGAGGTETIRMRQYSLGAGWSWKF